MISDGDIINPKKKIFDLDSTMGTTLRFYEAHMNGISI